MAEPSEVAAVRERLGALPAEWLDDQIVDAYLGHAAADSAARLVAESLAAATLERDEALVALARCEAGATERLITACSAVLANQSASHLVQVAPIPPTAFDAALGRARAATDAIWPLIQLEPLAYLVEMDLWREACVQDSQPLDPPIGSDLENGLRDKVGPVQARVALWHRDSESWMRDVANRGTDPYSLLAAAGSRVFDQAPALIKAAVDLNTYIRAANQARTAGGRTWSVSTARTAATHRITV